MIDWKKYGNTAYSFCETVFPLNRSLISEGSRQTLNIFESLLESRMEKLSWKSGEHVGDWIVPQEWAVNFAELRDSSGNVLLSYKENNLHLMGYSTSIQKRLSKQELIKSVYIDKRQSNAVPYVTSYYQKKWGFCASSDYLNSLPDGEYVIDISTDFFDSELESREIVIKGHDDSREILLSSYCCHPSMANNELSGPAVLLGLLSLFEKDKPPVTIRAVIGPESIGAISYLSKRIATLKRRCIGGFVLSCIGDNRAYSIIRNKRFDSRAYLAVKSASSELNIDLKEYGFNQRGSDERQYCSNNVDLDVVCLCRSKFGEYPEYHSSNDNLSIVSSDSLADSIEWVYHCIIQLSDIEIIRVKDFIGEPCFSKHFDQASGYQLDPGREALLLRHMYAYSNDNLSLPCLKKIMSEKFSICDYEFESILEHIVEAGLFRKEKINPENNN